MPDDSMAKNPRKKIITIMIKMLETIFMYLISSAE